MELSLRTKFRIAAAVAVGVILIGILGRPLASPGEPFGAVRFSNLGVGGAVVLLALAFLAGLVGYFVSWPHGREIGILAVPSGLAVWAVRTGDMASQIQMNPGLDQRLALLATTKWEPFFWLLVIATGFAGVLCGQRIRLAPATQEPHSRAGSVLNSHLNAAVAVVASVLIATIALGKLAQDVQMTNGELGSVMSQPAIGQVVFGVFFAFGLAAFAVKVFLNAGYIWPIFAAAVVVPFAIATYAKADTVSHLALHWPGPFFSNTALAVLPIQMVSLGSIGAIAGYWMGIRYDFWRKHEL